MLPLKHLTISELETGLEHIRQSPRDNGRIEMIVRRPRPAEREILEAGQLDLYLGLAGDGWSVRGSGSTPDGSSDPRAQITIMNVRAIALIAQDRARWALAGDQLYIDLDLSLDNLPPGTRLALGGAIVEISELPHTGCASFSQRFGADAMRFVNSPAGKQLRLRGVNAKVVQEGSVRCGDVARKM